MRKQEPKKIRLTPSDIEIEVRGSLVNISSVNGIVAIGLPGYSAAKAGIQAITRNGAQFYGPYGIRVNSVSPGFVESPLIEKDLQNPKFLKTIERHTALKRVGKPEEIAALALYLASDEAGFITGCDYPIDGGFIKLNN